MRFSAASRHATVSSFEYVSDLGVFSMAMPSGLKINPAKIFEQGDCFHQALAILRNVVHPENIQLAVTLGEPVMVIGALTIELFLKCLICIETGEVPRGHDLKELFDRLGPSIRSRIQNSWDTGIAIHRAKEWDDLENSLGIKMPRDLPSALAVGSKAFERIRYSYEGGTQDLQYYLQDLPLLLGRVILEMRPEWKTLRRTPQQLPQPSRH
jgi:hypothetical protein